MKLKYLSTLLLGSLLACSPEAPKLIPAPDKTNEKIDDNAGVQTFNPEVDILFVVDNSGSMDSHQRNLARNIDKFVNAFSNSASIEFHIGVVTTDMDNGRECCGKLVGHPTFVEKNTPNLIQALSSNLRVGTSGSPTETVFDPSIEAISGSIANTYNKGFYRPDAYLALVFITDAEDQGRYSPRDLYDALVNLKGGDKDKVIAYGVIVPSGIDNCPRDGGESPRAIENFLGMVTNKGNNIYSLCDPQFGDKITKIGDDLVSQVGRMILLNRPPILESIHVYYGTQELPRNFFTGWSFDPDKNAIILGDKIVWSKQPKGTNVRVVFEAATYKP